MKNQPYLEFFHSRTIFARFDQIYHRKANMLSPNPTPSELLIFISHNLNSFSLNEKY